MNTLIAFLPIILIALFICYHVCIGIIKKIGKPQFYFLVFLIMGIASWMSFWLR